MPVHVEQLTSDVTVADGELPLTDAQIEKLVKIVLQRLERKERDARWNRQATAIRDQAAPGWKPER